MRLSVTDKKAYWFLIWWTFIVQTCTKGRYGLNKKSNPFPPKQVDNLRHIQFYATYIVHWRKKKQKKTKTNKKQKTKTNKNKNKAKTKTVVIVITKHRNIVSWSLIQYAKYYFVIAVVRWIVLKWDDSRKYLCYHNCS